MADCTAPAKSGIPEALGLHTLAMDGSRWVISVEAARALGYSSPDCLTSRLRNDPFTQGRDWRVIRGVQCLRLARAAGLSERARALTVLTEDALAMLVEIRHGERGAEARALTAGGARAVAPPVPAPPPSDRLGLDSAVFEGKDVAKITLGGKDCWIALEVGRALEYASDGRGLVEMLVRDWRDEFTEGDHLVVAKADVLKLIKDAVNSLGGAQRVDPRAPSLTLLTRAGLWLVLSKTEKPVGQRFRRWLSGEVREAAEEGRAVATGMNGEALPAAPAQQLAFDFTASEADNRRERRLLMQAEHRHKEASRKLDLEASKLDIEVGKLQVGFAEKVVGWDLTDPLKREVVRATAKAIGLDVAGAK